MRTLAIGLMLLVGGCGSNMGLPGGGGGGGSGGSAGSGGSGGSGGGTGGNGGGDMSGSGGGGTDASALYGCNEVLSCIGMCGGPTNHSCVSMCRSGATQTGRGLWQQLSGCLRFECYVHRDASMEPCVQGMSMQTAQCTQCISDAMAPAGTCAADPHCGSCNMEYSACAADK